jgi:hypothetical protein
MGTADAIRAYPYALGKTSACPRVVFHASIGSKDKVMKQPILILALALGFSAGLAAGASADQTAPASTQIQSQSAQMPSQPARGDDSDPYRASLTRSLASPYDFADVYTNSEGFPLPGWAHMNNTK